LGCIFHRGREFVNVRVSQKTTEYTVSRNIYIMNTRQTIRNRDDTLTGDSEDERDRERDDYERQRERDEKRYRERGGDRGRTREPLSRRVTGAESQRQPRELKRRGKNGHRTPPHRSESNRYLSGATPTSWGVPDQKSLRPDTAEPSHPIPGEADRHQRVNAACTMTHARHMSAGYYLTTT